MSESTSGSPRRSFEPNPFRQFATADLLKERECYQYELADIESDPDDWWFPKESRAFVVMRLSDVNAEIGRRKQLAGKPNAPAWPKRVPSEMKEELEEIRYRLELLEYVKSVTNAEFELRGRTHWCCCPLPGHNDATASFHIDPHKQSWYCFGCGRGGGIFEFARQFYGIGEFWRAVDLLREQAGLPKPEPLVTGPGLLTSDGQTLAVSVAPRRSRSSYGRRS